MGDHGHGGITSDDLFDGGAGSAPGWVCYLANQGWPQRPRHSTARGGRRSSNPHRKYPAQADVAPRAPSKPVVKGQDAGEDWAGNAIQ